MKLKDFQYSPKKRRGLSTVVGALIFVVLLVSASSMFGLALQTQSEMTQTAKIVANADLKKQQEDFSMDAYTDNGNPAVLTIDVEALGQNPVEIFSLVITEETDINGIYPTTVYDIPADTSFIAPGYTLDVVSTPPPITLTLPVGAELSKVYGIKVISSLGTIKTDSILCDQTSCIPAVAAPGEGSLTSTVFLDGPNGVNGKISTVVMFVSNTSEETILDVKPVKGFTAPLCDDMWTNDDSGETENNVDPETVTLCAVTPAEPPAPQIDLGPHQSTIFKWDATINGDIGSTFTFCSSVTGDDGTPPLVTSLETCDMLTIIDPNDCGGCGPGGEFIILLDDLLIRPSIFLTIPSPFGDAEAKGIWGINVANPTNTIIEIPRVTLTAFSPGSQDQDIMFDDSGGAYCDPISVGSPAVPAVSQNWACNQENVMVWQDYTTPIILQPYTVQSFLAKVMPGKSGGKNDESTVQVISTTVFSSLGSFGKGNYQSIMFGATDTEPGLLVNVYMSNVLNGSGDNEIEITRMNIDDNSVQNFNIVLAEFSQDTEHKIGIGTELIINVPRGWHTVGVDSWAGFEDTPTVTLQADGSYQIVGTTDELIGTLEPGVDARTIQFHATAPDVDVDIMHVMYVLADGLTFPEEGDIGPLSEIVLHVIP